MNLSLSTKLTSLVSIFLLSACVSASTQDKLVESVTATDVPAAVAAAAAEKPFAEHKVILQLSTQERESDVLDVANNLIKYYEGPDYIDIEIVTFNEGVRLMYDDSPHKARIASLVENGVRFSVCKNTLDSKERKTGVRPVLNPHATVVQAGVAHMLTLIENGYVPIKP